MSQQADDLKARLSVLIKEQKSVLDRLGEVVSAGDSAAQDACNARLRKLTADVQRASHEIRYAEATGERTITRNRLNPKTLREQALDVIDEIGVPAAPALIEEMAWILTGAKIASSRFASLRRDEERAARRDFTARPAWIAPALSTTHLTPFLRLLTSSAWPIERRLIGGRSARVNHLAATLAFADRLDRMVVVDAPQAQDMERLVARFARGVPGAIEPGARLDTEHLREVVGIELAAIEDLDRAERVEASARLRRHSLHQQTWGLPPLTVVDGGAKAGVR
jgi:hypothetical protein